MHYICTKLDTMNNFVLALKAELKKRKITMKQFCLMTGWSYERINTRLAKLTCDEYIEACHLLNIDPRIQFREFKPSLNWSGIQN